MKRSIVFCIGIVFGLLCNLDVLTLTAADTTPPTIQSVNPPPNSRIYSLTNITITFSEPIQGIAWDDLFINGNPAVSVTGNGATWTFTLDQPPYGPVIISWDPGHNIHDLAGNRFNESNAGWTYTLVDNQPPTIVAIFPQPGLEIRRLSKIEIQFSEALVGIDAGDLLINGVASTNMQPLAGYRYVFSFPQLPAGTVNVTWNPQHGISDLFGNAFQAQSFSYTVNPSLGMPTLRINEVLAQAINTNGFKDEDGQLQDWIEIYNYGQEPINLAGFGLTDDPNDPYRWTFPSTNINPGQYMVIFASEKNRKVPGKPLHTNFRLNIYGDYVGLFSPDISDVAVSEFAPKFPELRNDYSYGYDVTGNLRYFSSPTPGAPNGLSKISGIAPPPHFNVRRGFYNAPIKLILSSEIPDATIRYTTNGSEPTAVNGYTYTEPLTITNTTIFRAATFVPNMLPSLTETHTYLFIDQVLKQPNNPPGFPVGSTLWGGYPTDYEMDPEIVNSQQYSNLVKPALLSLPTLSIVMNIDDLFGAERGIYTHSSDSQTLYRGPDWERPCSAEFILTNGETGFQINCGIQIQGNASRNPQKTPKHPLRLLFKGVFGPTELEYPVFPESPVTRFDSLVMRADFNNSWLHWDPNQRSRGTRIRDAWGKETMRDMGYAAPYNRFFHLYLNGLYWGVYEFSEKIDANFAANYFGGKKSDYDAIASKPTEAIDGDLTAFNTMANYIKGNNMADTNKYLQACMLLDMTNFVDYMLINFFSANQDWGNDSNWNAIHRRAPNEPVRFLAWDLERFIENPTDNRVSNTDVPVGLHTVLINSPEYRLLFADRIQKHLFNNGALTIENNIKRWQKFTNIMQTAIVGESARWGDYRRDVHQYQNGPYYLYTLYDHWLPEVSRLITNYFPARNSNFLNQVISAGLYPNPSVVTPPSFNQHGGIVSKGFILKTTNAITGTVYFTTNGVDPRVFGSGDVSPAARVLGSSGFVINNSVNVQARTYNNGVWSALVDASFVVESIDPGLRVTEIMYNPIGGDAYEFIELMNVSDVPLNVGLWGISGEIRYNFPPNTIIKPGEVIVLASDNNPTSWTNRYPGVSVSGWFDGKLANGGGRIVIKDNQARVICVVEYDDEGGWPVEADGSGYSLELINVNGDMRDVANWRASSVTNGTPGVYTMSGTAPVVRINEVMAWNVNAVPMGTAYPDWIELYNSGSTPVDISGWSLSDDGNIRKYVFPNGTIINAGGYLVVWCGNITGSGLIAKFGLNLNGDFVKLYDKDGRYVDGVSFGPQVADYSLGLINNKWTLCVPTPGESNQVAVTGSETNLVINEWLANPPSGGDDWIELYNRSSLPVSLKGLCFKVPSGSYRYGWDGYIAGGSYVKLWCRDGWMGDETGFNLPKEGGFIELYSATGMLIDRVEYSTVAENITVGRYPDGGSMIRNFLYGGTPGKANEVIVYSGPVINEVMAWNSGVVTNWAGRFSDWIELKNRGTSDFDMSGMGLSDSPDQARWIFPPGTIIPAGGYLIIWCDGGLAASSEYSTNLNCGFGLKSEGGGLYLYDTLGRVVDALEYGNQISDRSIGRVYDGSVWELLATPTPGSRNSAVAQFGNVNSLRINEYLANSPADDDWIEVYNTNVLPVKLTGLRLRDTAGMLDVGDVIGALSYIGGNSWARFIADGKPQIGHLRFRLNERGEVIQLVNSDGSVIDSIYFGPQKASVSVGRIPDGGTNFAEIVDGTGGYGNYSRANGVRISRVIRAANGGVEIKNFGVTTIDLSGWWISDSFSNYKKYRLPAGSVLSRGGSTLISLTDLVSAGLRIDFVNGGEIWLLGADSNGDFNGIGDRLQYNGLGDGMSYGIISTSAGLRKGVVRAQNNLGPLVISELMYNPPSGGYEYIEIQNITTNSVKLYDENRWWARWAVNGGVKYRFPAGAEIRGGGYILIVNFDPNDFVAQNNFRVMYGISWDVPLYGPYDGSLRNSGDTVILECVGNDNEVIEVDRVEYTDGSDGVWDALANGLGYSLQRIRPWDFGNEPGNWHGNIPTPGRANRGDSGFIDRDNDGMDSVWESSNGFNDMDSADAFADADDDGLCNLFEYWLGTDPRNPASFYKTPRIIAGVEDKSGVLGQAVRWEIQATGEGSLNYRWLKDGQVIPGANSATLAITNMTESDVGLYQVAVIGNGGVVVSEPMRLIGLIPPKIVVQPVSITVTNGSNAVFSVVATGTGVIRYQWKKDGIEIPGATNAVFGIPNVSLSDIGLYSVVVTDDISSVESEPAQLIVMMAPTILRQPQHQFAFLGDTVEFDVEAIGTQPLWYRWRRVSTGIATNIGFSKLILTNVQAAHAQFYNVIITNIAKPSGVISSNAYLIVITNWPKADQVVQLGGSCSFGVGAAKYSGLALSYQWQKNGVDIPGATNLILTITNVTPADAGTYAAVITAPALGMSYTTPGARLIIAGPAISGFKLTSNNALELTISGPTNMTYWLQSSSNLITWQDMFQIDHTGNETKVSIPITNSVKNLFLRIKGMGQ